MQVVVEVDVKSPLLLQCQCGIQLMESRAYYNLDAHVGLNLFLRLTEYFSRGENMTPCRMTDSQTCCVVPQATPLFFFHLASPLNFRICVRNQEILGIIIPSGIPRVICLLNEVESCI